MLLQELAPVRASAGFSLLCNCPRWIGPLALPHVKKKKRRRRKMLLIRRVKQPTMSEFNPPDRSHKLGRSDETLRHSGYCCWLPAGFQKRSHRKVKINSCLMTLEYSYKSILPSLPVMKDLTSLSPGLYHRPRSFLSGRQSSWRTSVFLIARRMTPKSASPGCGLMNDAPLWRLPWPDLFIPTRRASAGHE